MVRYLFVEAVVNFLVKHDLDDLPIQEIVGFVQTTQRDRHPLRGITNDEASDLIVARLKEADCEQTSIDLFPSVLLKDNGVIPPLPNNPLDRWLDPETV